jgi:hypothetical protein
MSIGFDTDQNAVDLGFFAESRPPNLLHRHFDVKEINFFDLHFNTFVSAALDLGEARLPVSCPRRGRVA